MFKVTIAKGGRVAVATALVSVSEGERLTTSILIGGSGVVRGDGSIYLPEGGKLVLTARVETLNKTKYSWCVQAHVIISLSISFSFPQFHFFHFYFH